MELKIAIAIWALLWSSMLMSSFREVQSHRLDDEELQRAAASGSMPLSLCAYKTEAFSLDEATPSAYKSFIGRVRDQLKSGKVSQGIALLNTNSLAMSERYLLINLTSLADVSITLAIDRVNVYVVGYLGSNSNAYFFSDEYDLAKKYLFTTSKQSKLPFNGSYPDLVGKAGADRSKIDLGLYELDQAIQNLYYAKVQAQIARAFIITIQIISEAARFEEIENDVAPSITMSPVITFRPDAFVLDLENNWGKLSTSVQQANANGDLKNSITIDKRTFSKVSEVKNIISLLLALTTVNDIDSQMGRQASHILKLIRLVVDDCGEIGCVTMKPSVASIVGYRDLCLQAIGASVQLKQCNHNFEEQKWALYGDDTIRPNRDPKNCLTPIYDSSIGQYVITINGCMGSSGQRWLFTETGMILNQITQKVMDVRGATSNYHQILLYAPNGSPDQSWRLSFSLK